MGEPSAARGLVLLLAGVWLFTRTFKGGLANKVAQNLRTS